jgi:hypothetical protein
MKWKIRVDSRVPDIDKSGKQKVILGYVGKPKGMKQLLQERGLWISGMTADGKEIPSRGYGCELSIIL